MSDGPVRPGSPAPLWWAFYLAISWTWCIGMFLPVLLVRDYGLGGWLVFAIPNVIGAAAMGFVLRTGASERLVREHRGAMLLFSLVTIAFHFYWIGWLSGAEGGVAAIGLTVIVVAIAAVGWAVATRDALACLTATIVWLVSALAAAFVFHYRRNLSIDLPTLRPEHNLSVLGLAPACVFGFLLCPYLDLTFHRARQGATAAGAKIAFAAGFGGFFLAMILFTLLYAQLVWMRPIWWAIPAVLAGHWTLQAGVTIGLHAREVSDRIGRWMPVAIAAVVPLAFIGWVVNGTYANLSFGEIGYRLFMAAYGLLFPAYVLLTMIGRRPAWTSLAATLLASPFYWIGFIERRPAWIIVAAVPIALLFLVPKRSATIEADEDRLRAGQV